MRPLEKNESRVILAGAGAYVVSPFVRNARYAIVLVAVAAGAYFAFRAARFHRPLRVIIFAGLAVNVCIAIAWQFGLLALPGLTCSLAALGAALVGSLAGTRRTTWNMEDAEKSKAVLLLVLAVGAYLVADATIVLQLVGARSVLLGVSLYVVAALVAILWLWYRRSKSVSHDHG